MEVCADCSKAEKPPVREFRTEGKIGKREETDGVNLRMSAVVDRSCYCVKTNIA